MSVQQILRETLDNFETQKANDETLGPLKEMWKKEKAKMIKRGDTVAGAGGVCISSSIHSAQQLTTTTASDAPPPHQRRQPQPQPPKLFRTQPPAPRPSPSRRIIPAHRRSKNIRKTPLTSRAIDASGRSTQQRTHQRIRRKMPVSFAIDTGLHPLRQSIAGRRHPTHTDRDQRSTSDSYEQTSARHAAGAKSHRTFTRAVAKSSGEPERTLRSSWEHTAQWASARASRIVV